MSPPLTINFSLPSHLIAHEPSPTRDLSKLMHISPNTGNVLHTQFKNIADILKPNDMLILNTSKVLHSRFFCTRKSEGKIEVTLVEKTSVGHWKAMIKKSKKLKKNEHLYIDQNLYFTVLEINTPFCVVKLPENISPESLMQEYGKAPLPPYIKRQADQSLAKRYQTVYAKQAGAIAAPTAGLHFTKDLLQNCINKGIKIETLTLHVGYGTFQSLNENHFKQNKLHTEHFYIDPDTANKLKAHKGRKIAVGTTVTRALESAYNGKIFNSGWQQTNIFIKPTDKIKTIDGMITNFHLPNTSLLLLVASLTGINLLQKAYQIAIEKEYRFYSFGDAMLILND